MRDQPPECKANNLKNSKSKGSLFLVMAYIGECAYAHRSSLDVVVVGTSENKWYQCKLEKDTGQWLPWRLSRSIKLSAQGLDCFSFRTIVVNSHLFVLFQESLFSQTQAVFINMLHLWRASLWMFSKYFIGFQPVFPYPSGRNKYKFTPTHWKGIAQEQLLGHQMQAGGREWEHSQPPPSVLLPFPTHPAKCSLVSLAGGSHPCFQVCSGSFPPEINELWKDSQVLGNSELPRTTLAKAKSQDRKPLAETGGGHKLSTCVQAGLPAADVQWGQSSSSSRVRSPQPQPRGSA